MSAKPRIRDVLWRGLRRRCPHCGCGALFAGWFSLRRECAECRLRFEQRSGDTWAFWLIGDRVFVALVLLAVYLGFRSSTPTRLVFFFLAAAVPLVATMPQRLGVCVALDYLSRVWLGQPSEVPPYEAPTREVGDSERPPAIS